jgi:long-chain fatty acid transport protein
MCRTCGIAFLACALLAQAAVGQADGVVLDGISARTLGRGGTNLGHSDNGGILHDNPAGMAGLGGDELLDVGAVVLLTDFGYSDPANEASSESITPLPQVAYLRRSEDGAWVYGLGLFAPAGFTERYLMEGPAPYSGEREYYSFGALMKVLPALSCQVTDRLSVGGTFGVGICHAELEGPYTLQGPLTGQPTLLDTQATGATPVWSAGLQYALTPRTTIGAAYISESRFTLQGTTAVDVFPLGGTTYESELDVTWPRSVGVGMRHEVCPCGVLSADVIWYDWSQAFDEFVLRLSNSSVTGFPDVEDHFPLNWRDTVSTRLGYEWKVASGTMRLGYVYHRNPIPDATLTPFIQAILEHSVSLGYGWCSHGWEIDLSYMCLFGQDRAVGTSELAGDDFDNSRHEATVHAINFGFMKRL